MTSSTVEEISITNADEFSIPKCLDNKFFEEHLRKYYKNNEIEVISFNGESATGKGENYSSCINRVNVLFSAPTGEFTSRERDVSERLFFFTFFLSVLKKSVF